MTAVTLILVVSAQLFLCQHYASFPTLICTFNTFSPLYYNPHDRHDVSGINNPVHFYCCLIMIQAVEPVDVLPLLTHGNTETPIKMHL